MNRTASIVQLFLGHAADPNEEYPLTVCYQGHTNRTLWKVALYWGHEKHGPELVILLQNVNLFLGYKAYTEAVVTVTEGELSARQMGNRLTKRSLSRGSHELRILRNSVGSR